MTTCPAKVSATNTRNWNKSAWEGIAGKPCAVDLTSRRGSLIEGCSLTLATCADGNTWWLSDDEIKACR